jgi:raffinose/stachyose/melibiose transport system permease protein
MDTLHPHAEAPGRSRRSAVRDALRRGGLNQVPWLLAAPGLAAVVIFHFVAVGFGAYYAFTSWGLVSHANWVGLANFREIFSDADALAALRHTVILAGCSVVLVNTIGLTLALALNTAVKTRHLLRLVFFAPVVLSSLAIGVIWRWIFDYYGGLNHVLAGVGLGSWQHAWLGDPSTALWAILAVMVWHSSGLAMVLYLAALQAIPDEIHEAMLVDGASFWLRLRKVLLPLLAPAITITATLVLIGGLRVFATVRVLTNGGPIGSTETVATHIYSEAFYKGRYGYGAAYSLVFAALIAVIALTQLAFLRINERRL